MKNHYVCVWMLPSQVSRRRLHRSLCSDQPYYHSMPIESSSLDRLQTNFDRYQRHYRPFYFFFFWCCCCLCSFFCCCCNIDRSSVYLLCLKSVWLDSNGSDVMWAGGRIRRCGLCVAPSILVRGWACCYDNRCMHLPQFLSCITAPPDRSGRRLNAFCIQQSGLRSSSCRGLSWVRAGT